MNRDDALGLVCVGVIVAVPLCLLLGAVLLRTGIALANLCLGGGAASAPPPDDDYSYEDYRRPRGRGDRTAPGVPAPGIGRCMVIVLVVWLANVGGGIFLGLMMLAAGGAAAAKDPNNELVMNLVSLPIGFVITSLVQSGMLPTSFGRACLVTVFEYVISFALAIALVAVMFAVLGGFGGLQQLPGFKA